MRRKMTGNTLAAGNGGNATSFKAGVVPWNAGTRGVMKANSGSFRPGQTPHNVGTVGEIRVRVDKGGNRRQWVRTGDGWRLLSRHVWASVHGPVPRGMVIHHVDRDTLNDALSNLRAMTRAEHINEHRHD